MRRKPLKIGEKHVRLSKSGWFCRPEARSFDAGEPALSELEATMRFCRCGSCCRKIDRSSGEKCASG
jgi:hypothetical protein